MDEIDIAVIGAGPHGLAAAATLREAGAEVRIIGEPMSFWHAMPEGMWMRSRRSGSSILSSEGKLSMDGYAAATGIPVPRHPTLAEFIEYGMWFQSMVAPDVDRRRVAHLARDGARFMITFEGGERLRANRVLVAAGIEPFTHRPALLKSLPEGTASHVADHRKLDVFKGQNVLVVGGGQSALESATLMHEAGADVEVLARGNQVFWLHGDGLMDSLGRLAPLFYAPTDVGPIGISRLVATPNVFRHVPRPAFDVIAARAIRPAGASWLKPRMTEIPITSGTSVVHAEPNGEGLRVELSDGTRRKADHLLFATGYKIDIERYPFLDQGLAKSVKCVDGYPVLRRGMESSVRGLHFLGAPAARSFGPVMRFVAGSWFAAPAVTKTVMKSSRRRTVDTGPADPDCGQRVLMSLVRPARGERIKHGGGTPTTGALVVGGDYQGLGIARSLGRRGIPVVVLDDEFSIARVSRYVKRSVRVPALRTEAETVDALLEVGDRLGLQGWVLFPTREETVAAISANRDRLLETYRVPTPPWETVRQAWDKRATYGLAEELGVDAPRCWFPSSEDELAQIPVDSPVVIKPAIKENFIYETKAKAWRADSAAELVEVYRRACQVIDPAEIIVQEMIPGGGAEQLAYCAFFRAGEPVASMTVRRRRQHPSDFGRASTFVETIDLPEIEEPSQRFLKAIDYYGLGRAGVQAGSAGRAGQAARRQRPDLGLPLARGRRRSRLPAPAVPGPAGAAGGAQPLPDGCPLDPPEHRRTQRREGPDPRRPAGGGVPQVASRRARRVGVVAARPPPGAAGARPPALPRRAPRSLKEEQMFTSTERFPFFDYFRVPYEVDTSEAETGLPRGVARLRVADRESGPFPSLYWWRAGAASHQRWRSRPGRFSLAGFTLVAPVLRDFPLALSQKLGSGGWQPEHPIKDADGSTVASVWVDRDGNVFLPFDPGEAMSYLWSERYNQLGLSRWTGALRSGMVKGYYAVRPVLPRAVQIRLRQGYAAAVDLPDFPGWPAEHSLHDLYDWLWELVGKVAGEPVPYLSPWPAGKDSALLLTHDVETEVGRDNIEHLRAPERELGFRSSWNFVPLRYDVPDALVGRLKQDGCEVGVHGLRHDGQDMASARKLRKRLPLIREYAERWGAVGFRSPATQRIWKLMPTTGFDYDSSYHDSAPHEPQPGGSCTYLPFFNEQLVELPMTVPMDHTLFEILGHTDGTVWKEKAEDLRRRGGMICILVHPDYVECPGLLEAWKEFLAQFSGDDSVWQPLPMELSAWWRRRAESAIERRAGAWRVCGPAADEAEVRFGGARGREDHETGAFSEMGESHVDHDVAG